MTAESANLLNGRKFYELDLPRSLGKIEAGEGEGQREAAWSSAARIDVEDAVAQVGFWLVSVATDYDLEAGSGGVQVEMFEIVEDVD